MVRHLLALCMMGALLGIPAGFAEEPAPVDTWQVIVEAEGRGEIEKLALAPNGDILVAGFLVRTGSGDEGPHSDAWLARYAPDGQQLWSRLLGDEYRDEALDMSVSTDGTITIAGWRDVEFTAARQASNGFVARFSADGELLWQSILSDPSRLLVISSAVLLDDGSVLVAGHDDTASDPGTRALAAKVSADGRMEWMFNPPEYVDGQTPLVKNAIRAGRPDGPMRALESARIGHLGLDDTVEIQVIQATPAGPTSALVARCANVSLSTGQQVGEACGPPLAPGYRPPDRYSGETVGGFVNGDALIRQFDPSGREVWSRTLKSDGGDGVHAVASTPDGGVVGAGFALSGPRVERDNWDGLLIRLDSSGHEVWRRKFGGDKRDELNGVAVLEDGSIVAAGYTGSQDTDYWKPWLMRLNARGELEGSE